MKTGVQPQHWEKMPEGETFLNTVGYILHELAKADEASAKGKKYVPFREVTTDINQWDGRSPLSG